MIDAREFRIGNWFIDYETEPERTIYWQVEKIEPNGVWYRNGSCWTTKPTPILLDSAILEKCGFKGAPPRYDATYSNGDMATVLFADKRNLFILNGVILSRDIHYLHELQNITYVFTNTELNFKP